MIIDELLKIYQDFSKSRPSITKLEARKLRALATINQDVVIRDLVVRTSPPHCYGESQEHTNTYSRPTVPRLKDHISMLFDLANEDHRARNCVHIMSDGSYRIQAGKENCITRLSMPEFSLYTKRPLSMAEYAKLCEDIDKLECPLDPNVHVLLSSFAVINSHGELLNMSLYVEGGKSLTMHSFVKNKATSEDISYGNSVQLFSQYHVIDRDRLFSQQHVNNHNKATSGTRVAVISETGEIIYTGSAFEIETVGKAHYTQTVDVCIELESSHGTKQLKQRILENVCENEFIPDQVEQCVTSNSIYIISENIIADRVLHADADTSMLDPKSPERYDYRVSQGKLVLSHEAIKRIKPERYETVISDSPRGYSIAKPPFGSDCVVELIKERPAGHYLPALQEQVKIHNKAVLANQLVAARQRELSNDEKTVQKMVQEGTIKGSISARLDQLERKLLLLCQPSFLQKHFKTEELREKVASQKIIEDEFDRMKDIVKTHGDDSIYEIMVWKRDLELRLNMVGSSPTSALKSALNTAISKTIDVDLINDLHCSFDELPDEDNKPSMPF